MALPRGVVAAARVLLLVQWLVLLGWAASWLWLGKTSLVMGYDFRVYWSAAWTTLHNGPLAAYDPVVHQAIEAAFFPGYQRQGPWVYPPTYQLLVTPLALLAYPVAYAVWVALAVVCLRVSTDAWRRAGELPWTVILAFPGMWIAMVCGQNSLITLALMVGALAWLDRRPAWAGVCAGLLAFKPQLAVLIPLVYLVAGQGRAFLAAALTAVGFVAAATLCLGIDVWPAFFATLPRFNADVVQQGADGIWAAMPTVFAASRRLGASLPLAYALHALVAAPVAVGALWLWWRDARRDLCLAATLLATLIVQPYLLYYELAWLIVPVLCLVADMRREGVMHRAAWALPTVLWLLPLQAYAAVYVPALGQWGVVLLPLAFAWTAWRALAGRRGHNDAHREASARVRPMAR